MKKSFSIIFCLSLIIHLSSAQTPNSFKYQAVVRNTAGQIVVNQNVGFRFSILQGSTTGTSVYSEKHTTQTNAFGLVNLEIGKGIVLTGTFAAINWDSNSYFVKIELDASGSGSFSELGTSQLLAVPYALYAAKAGNGFSGSYTDLTNKPTLFSGSYTDLTNKPVSFSGNYIDLSNKPVFATVATTGSYTDLLNQPALFSGSYTNLTNKPSLSSVATSGSYADLTNKPTLFSGSYTNLTNKPVFAVVATSGSYNDLTDKPSMFSVSYNNLLDKPTFTTVATTGSYTDLLNKPALFSGSYTNLTNKPVLAAVATSGSYADLTNKPVLFSGSYTNLTNLPAFATVATSGSYTDLLNKPNMLATAATPQSGDILYNDGTSWLLLAKGIDGQVLKLESGLPKWKQVSDFASVIPTAVFSVSQLLAATTQTINVDASACIDDADLKTDLQVRWRWVDGGAFTAWSTTKTATNIYTTEGVKNITLEVKDSQGNVGTTSKGVSINNSQFLPLVFTNATSNITTTTASCGGNIVASGGMDVTARGICWSIKQNPTLTDNKTTDGTGLGYYSSSLTGLTAGTNYYLRAYATNSIGTSYGNEILVKTVLNVVFPTVTTDATSNITANAVTSGGNVTNTGGDIVTARGVCWSANQNPTVVDSKTIDGTGTGSFKSQIAGLIPGTYYARAYATNSAGSGYGNMVTFTTEKTLPVLTTKTITEISAMGGVSGGTITSAGGGTILERGICWNNSPNPTITNEKITSPATTASFNAAIAKASPGTTYYLRAYATSEIGTGYGDQKTFTTSDAAYHQSFETGMTPAGWAGPFTVTNESALEGSYSFMSLYGANCDATITTILTTSGQIGFYYSYAGGASSIDFYIDDILIANFPNNSNGWRQGLAPVSAGTHIFKWHYNDGIGNNQYGAINGKCYIDQIIITK